MSSPMSDGTHAASLAMSDPISVENGVRLDDTSSRHDSGVLDMDVDAGDNKQIKRSRDDVDEDLKPPVPKSLKSQANKEGSLLILIC